MNRQENNNSFRVCSENSKIIKNNKIIEKKRNFFLTMKIATEAGMVLNTSKQENNNNFLKKFLIALVC